mmetsp:Transcript_14371/g.43508  ORF Transcript_14371/g.43508 Transcript_14371/m.43508 type:complete len:771 (+) Transcript_14371:24-2336(+)
MARAAKESYPARALPLIEIRGKDELVVNEETARLVAQIECPVCPVVVVGLYRTGKSTLLNLLRRELEIDDVDSGFEVGPSVARCTRGIWIWGRPYFVGEDPVTKRPLKCALLLDTEGIGGLEADAQYDARIFALSSLIASSLVYNSLGSLDEQAISQLSFVARLSEHVSFADDDDDDSSEGVGSGESEAETVARLSEFMPSFTWVVRDFSLELASAEGEMITSDEYLELALRPQRGYDASVLERNRLRQVVKAFFRTRACKTLVRPVVEEQDLAFVDQLEPSQLRPQFLAQLDEFRDHVFAAETLQPKTLGLGKQAAPLRGPAYVELLERFCSSFNGGGVPAVVSAWDHVSHVESEAALHEALEKFDSALALALQDDKLRQRASSADVMDLDSDEDDDVLSNGHYRPRVLESEAFEEAVATATRLADTVFQRRALGEAAREYLTKLHDAVAAKAADARRTNRKASARFCDDLAAKLYVATVAQTLDALAAIKQPRQPDDDDDDDESEESPRVAAATKKTKKKKTTRADDEDLPAGKTTKKKKKRLSSSTSTSSESKEPQKRRTRPSVVASPRTPAVDAAELAGKLAATWSEFRQRYESQSKGPAAEACLLAFLADKWPESCRELVRRLEAIHDLDRAGVQARLAKLKSELAEHRGQTDARAKMLDDTQQTLVETQLERAKLLARAEATQKQLKTARRDAARRVKDLEAKIANLELQLDDAQRRADDNTDDNADSRIHPAGVDDDHHKGQPRRQHKEAELVSKADCKCLVS